MHYYQFNIADYRKDTQHLTPIEHYIYRELIDWYYLDESPIPKKTQLVIRRLRLVTENNQDLINVLEEYFTETENGWVHGRIDQEIERYHNKAEVARANGNKGGRPKKPRKTQPVNLANPEITQGKANQEPRTINQLKEKDKKEKWIPPDWLNLGAWSEFESHRKEIKKPLTDLSRTKAANQLQGLDHKQQQQVINKSIQSRWAGLFPESIKNEAHSQSYPRPESHHARQLRELGDAIFGVDQ